jgi:uncharacterized protein
MELRGKRVLITGASRGIGDSLAHAFAQAGATVALVARTQDALQALAVDLGGTAHAADLADPTQVANLVDRIEGEAGPVDILVNNAGVESGCDAFPGVVAYAASKAALSHFTSGLRADLRGLPIRTTLVELGPVPTDMLAGVNDYEPTAKAFQRFYRMRLMIEVPREKVGDEVVEAVQ